MWTRQGSAGVVKYLKACSVLLQQSVGGYVIKDPSALGPKVSRTRTGIPRIIPSQMRQKIRSGDIVTIRFWLTLFSLYRVIEFPGKLKIATITDPGLEISRPLKEFDSFLVKFFIPLMRARVRLPVDGPRDILDPKAVFPLAAEPFLIGKSSPATAPLMSLYAEWASPRGDPDRAVYWDSLRKR